MQVRVDEVDHETVHDAVDHITERAAESGEFFGIGRLGDAVVAHRRDEPEALVTAVLDIVDRFGGRRPQDDDVTIVAMKVTRAD